MEKVQKRLSALLGGIGQKVPYKYKGVDIIINGITDDTRKLEPGFIFVCVRGRNFDGHTAAAQMLSKGAAAVVCDIDLGLKEKQIIVRDTREFYGLLAAEWFGHPEKKLILVGITGTNGKTTTAAMIHHIITSAGGKAGLIGTVDTLIGQTPVKRDENTPTTPTVFELYSLFDRMVMEKCSYCVMEVSSFALEQQRIGPAVFTCGVFTNLTRDHLDYHETEENYYQAKKKLFEKGRCRLAFINTDDEYGARLVREIQGTKFSYGMKGNSTSVYADHISFSGTSSYFYFCYPGSAVPINLHMMGSYNVMNAVAAIAAAAQLKVPMNRISAAMNSFRGVRGRCESIPTGRDFSIICDYAHSPDALENMLPAIKKHTEGRLICLFGCGGDRDRTKRPLMAQAAAKYADKLIITSDNPRNEDPRCIIDDIAAGLEGTTIPYERITSRKEAIFYAVKTAEKGDVIVLAGKGHEDYQVIKDNIHIHFDEREICAEALRASASQNTSNTAALSSGMSIDEICRACRGKRENIPDSSRLVNVTGISSDSRSILPGYLFMAFKGKNFDGHDFAHVALDNGAMAAVTEYPVRDLPCIVVESTAEAILDIAKHYRDKFTPRLVGITGSAGKTTTKEMTALALSSRYETLKTEKNYNNEIGMPFTMLQLKPSHKAAVIEMGMSGFGEIERMSRVCRPGCMIITNIGWSHAENLGSQEGILEAKLEMLKGAEEDAPLIINGDDPMLYPLINKIKDRIVVTCGISNKQCDYTAENIISANGTESFDLMYAGRLKAHLTLPCVGLHHVTDAMLAMAAAEWAGCDMEDAAKKLSGFKPGGLRQHIEKHKGQTVIIDCYNAAPNSMRAAIGALCEIEPAPGGKRAAVLGDMLELGDMARQLHEEVGEYAANAGVDLLVCFGENAAYIAEKARSLGTECFYSPDREAVVSFLEQKLCAGDAVLFKASRGMLMEDIINAYYDD